MKKLIFFFAFFVAILVGYAYYQNNPALSKFTSLLPIHPSGGATATIDSQRFSLMIAKTQEQKEKGLAVTNSLGQNMGMLFPFDHPDYFTFWMKDMKFPIDIIYLKNNHIVTIYPDMQPAKDNNTTWQIVKPLVPSDAVIEINAGLSQKYHFKIGDIIQLAL